MFYYLNQNHARENWGSIGISFSVPRHIKILIALCLPILFLVYAWITILMLIPPASETIQLKEHLGSGLNIIVLGVIILFSFSFYVRYILTSRYLFQDVKVTSLIYSTPFSVKKLVFGLVSLTSLLDYWICIFILEHYVIYQLIFGYSINVLHFLLVIPVSLIITLSGSFLGINSRIILRQISTKASFLNSPLIRLVSIGFIVIIPVLAIITNFQNLLIFSPLGWASLIMYTLFTGYMIESFLLILFCFLFLLFTIKLIPSTIHEEELSFTHTTDYSAPFSFVYGSYNFILSSFLSTSSQNIANMLSKEDWEQKRPLKFILSAIAVSLLLLTGYSILVRRYEFSDILFGSNQLIPLIFCLFCVITTLMPIVHREFAYSFFNYQDFRFLLFQSTPNGIQLLVKIKFFFVLIWQLPYLILVAIIFQFVFPQNFVYIYFPFLIGGGLLVTSIDLLYQSIYPQYFINKIIKTDYSTLILHLIRMTLAFFISAALILIMNAITTLALSSLIFLAFCIVFSYPMVRFSILKLENTEVLS